MRQGKSTAERVFLFITAYPRIITLLGLVLIGVGASFIPTLQKDTSANAFIDDDNPALLYREKVKETFGLEDPFVVAVVNESESGIYNPQSLALVQWLTDHVRKLDNVDPDGVTSLATESDVEGTANGMEVEPFFDPVPASTEEAAALRSKIEDFPLYEGSLVARDGQATLVVAEVLNEDDNRATYDALMELAAQAPKGPNDKVHVAGEGAVSGYLSAYIDQDAQKLNPLAGLIITLVLFLAFRTLRGVILPNVVVAATVAGALGSMAAAGVSFFVITNGLIVILIGIAVADSIHIFSRYYELVREEPDADQQTLVVHAMADMWRPVTLTTLTTIAGFIGLYGASAMPPMKYFGLFAAVGVFVAWLFSIVFLPAAMALLKPKSSRAFGSKARSNGRFETAMGAVGRGVLGRPAITLVATLLIAGVGGYGASKVIVEDQRIENFQHDEPIYEADSVINRHMDGVYHFDVMVETPKPEGLFVPERLRRIEALQRYAETLPHVNGSTSVADYIKQMHRAVNEGRAEAYRIPDDPSLIAQLFLLYSISGDPTDFEEEVDYDYQTALVRLNVDVGAYQNNRLLAKRLNDYIEGTFNTPDMTATLTGRLNVDYHWIDNVAESHLTSLFASLAMVWMMASLVFRSALAGVLSLLPVGAAILLIYGVMGFGGIWLGVGTSMFAAIAIGLGVDFAIHTIDRMRELLSQSGDDVESSLAPLYPSTGRALLFNFLALALGFLVLTTSEVPPLVEFGALVAVAVTSSFLVSLTLLPVVAKLLRPAFLFDGSASRAKPASQTLVAVVGAATLAFAASAPVPAGAEEDVAPAGREVMKSLNDREEGTSVARDLRMEMTDRNGTTRVRETRGYRKYFGGEKRTVLFYESPANVKGTAFLTYDYPGADRDDDQWLYLPGLRKVRRISASDRGDYFLGTDFTYEDIKNENKVNLSDYTFETVGQEDIGGVSTVVVEGTPVDTETAEELGYGRVRWHVDTQRKFSLRTEIWDVNGNPLKTIRIRDIRQVDGLWTATLIHAENLKNGHQTKFQFSNIDYESDVPDRVFTTQALRRGFY